MNDHINQLTDWWENAEQVAPMRGDLVIEDVTDEDGPDYRIRKWPGDMREKLSYVRVLEPKPKPAWHNARAVVAECKHDAPDQGRGTFINDQRGQWLDESGKRYVSADLRDVTPLIEAKVTDEMLDRVRKVLEEAGWTIDDANFEDGNPILTRALIAALGIEEE